MKQTPAHETQPVTADFLVLVGILQFGNILTNNAAYLQMLPEKVRTCLHRPSCISLELSLSWRFAKVTACNRRIFADVIVYIFAQWHATYLVEAVAVYIS